MTWWIPWKTFTCGPPSLKHPGPSKLRFDVTWFHPNTYCTNQTPWKPQEILGPGCLGRFTSGILFLWGVSCWTMCVCFLFFKNRLLQHTHILGFYFSLTHNKKSTMFLWLLVALQLCFFPPLPNSRKTNHKKCGSNPWVFVRRILQRCTPLAGTTPAGCTTPRGWTLAEGACLVCSQGLGAKLNKKIPLWMSRCI